MESGTRGKYFNWIFCGSRNFYTPASAIRCYWNPWAISRVPKFLHPLSPSAPSQAWQNLWTTPAQKGTTSVYPIKSLKLLQGWWSPNNDSVRLVKCRVRWEIEVLFVAIDHHTGERTGSHFDLWRRRSQAHRRRHDRLDITRVKQ
jgi:hypothetical protein